MATTPTELESKVQKAIKVRIERLGIFLCRRNVAAMTGEYKGKRRFVRFGEAGQSDLYGWDTNRGPSFGRHWEIEVKRLGNGPTEHQLDWLKKCHRMGAVAFWSDSANVAERVAESILAGGRIEWLGGCDFDVVMPG